MADYSFTTIWRLVAPIGDVFGDRRRANLAGVVTLGARRAPGRGGVNGATGVDPCLHLPRPSAVPAAARHANQPPRARIRLAGKATGELEGTRVWTLSEEDGWTTATRGVRTNRWWMNALARLPLVDPIFRLNHHAVMRDGLRGIRRRLGVRGTYGRIE